MSASDIYDFESIVETAAAQVLLLAGIGTVATSRTASQFQQKRPRIEVKLTLGPGLQRWVVVIDGVNYQTDPTAGAGKSPAELAYLRRESAWSCSLKFALITEADVAVHADYRSKARAALANLWVTINDGTFLKLHCLQLSNDGGSSEMMMSQDKNLFKTDCLFDGKISVQADAWPALITESET